ncbi:hypothetical protein BV25DRAFT_1830782 [Artomyces pyxidatus]|uniref:Uncharacterized protein n=1 Tax=Artomyces pyxidatus TaxID=48021 RepID=A0ACB8SPI2_9AGAM|nr:hypothetical protein BV25DRAFT_1830782 [Artomyces pyxidatus]
MLALEYISLVHLTGSAVSFSLAVSAGTSRWPAQPPRDAACQVEPLMGREPPTRLPGLAGSRWRLLGLSFSHNGTVYLAAGRCFCSGLPLCVSPAKPEHETACKGAIDSPIDSPKRTSGKANVSPERQCLI